MKTLKYIPIFILTIASACSPKVQLQYTDAIFSEKDSILIHNNINYSSASIVGGGANLAKQEKDTVLSIQLKNLTAKLDKINGVQINSFEIKKGDKNLKVSIQDDILFMTASHDLTESADQILEKVSTTLQEYPDIKIKVVGHTDNVGTVAYNTTLSKNRAHSVVNYLREKNLTNSIIEEGKSFNEPIASNSTDKGREKNRRVEITFN